VSELVWGGAGLNISMGQAAGMTLHTEAGVLLGEQVRIADGQLKIGFGFDIGLTHGAGRSLGNSAELNVSYAWK
jgi:hypothetical protein